MKTFRMKKGVSLLVGMMALAATAGFAQAAETRFAVQDAAGTTDKMVVQDTGYIGVGINAPTSGVHLKGTGGAEPTQVRTEYKGDISTGSGGLAIMRNRASGSLPIAGDRLGYLLFGATDPATNPPSNKYSAGLFTYADGVWTSSSTPSYYAFETTQLNKSSRDEWLRVTSSGKIGVNTPVPNMQLEVNGGLRLNASSTPATVTSPARTAPAKPVCDNTAGPNIRGTLWFTKGGVGVADSIAVCSKGADENYQWRTFTIN